MVAPGWTSTGEVDDAAPDSQAEGRGFDPRLPLKSKGPEALARASGPSCVRRSLDHHDHDGVVEGETLELTGTEWRRPLGTGPVAGPEGWPVRGATARAFIRATSAANGKLEKPCPQLIAGASKAPNSRVGRLDQGVLFRV